MKAIKQFILWGSAGHAKVLADIIKINGDNVVALFDNNLSAISCLPNVPLFFGESGFSSWIEKQKHPESLNAALAIGGTKGKDRQKIVSFLSLFGISFPSVIHPSASVSEAALLGRATQVLANSVISTDVVLGEACIVNNSATVDHECKLGDGVHVAPGAVLCGCVTVGDYSMIGAGAIVLPRIIVGKNVVIGAGSVVTRNISDDMTVAGNPAKVL